MPPILEIIALILSILPSKFQNHGSCFSMTCQTQSALFSVAVCPIDSWRGFYCQPAWYVYFVFPLDLGPYESYTVQLTVTCQRQTTVLFCALAILLTTFLPQALLYLGTKQPFSPSTVVCFPKEYLLIWAGLNYFFFQEVVDNSCDITHYPLL
jgi:hypothetical protein